MCVQKHTVPGGANTFRVMSLLCAFPFTVYAKVASFPSVNVTVASPTVVPVTRDESHGVASNEGPVKVEIGPE
jgi:hypothetical protein